MKLPMHHLPYVAALVRLHQRPMKLVDDGITDSAVRRLAVQAGDALDDLFTLCKADITTKNAHRADRYLRNYEVVRQKVLDVQQRDNLRMFQSPVRGEEIMSITGLPPSRTIGYLKFMVEEAILDGHIPNNYDAARDYLLANMQVWIAQADTAHFQRRGGKDE
jgi:poly(A) polymerase